MTPIPLPIVSIVVPALNEESNILRVCRRLEKVLDTTPYEILFIDDGSHDNTWAAILRAGSLNSRVRGISFSRNFGHQAALKAGLDNAQGECVITLDCDLEHPPELIPLMLARWRDGYQVVTTHRNVTRDLSLAKRIFSSVFYRVLNSISDIHIEPGSADFRLLDRQVVEICKSLPENDLFWRGIISWLGFRRATLTYDQGLRKEGRSRYSLLKMVSLSFSGLTGFSVKPLYASLFVGSSFALTSFLYLAYAVYIRVFTHHSISGWASLIACVLLMGSFQMLTLGIIGIYLGKLFMQAKLRPAYVVRERSECAEYRLNTQTERMTSRAINDTKEAKVHEGLCPKVSVVSAD